MTGLRRSLKFFAAWLTVLGCLGFHAAAQAETSSQADPRFRLIDPQLLGDEDTALDGAARVIPSPRGVFVIDAQGRLFGMGLNNKGRLGLGRDITASRHLVPILDQPVRHVAGHSHSLIVTKSGQLWAMGQNTHGQLGLGDTTDRYRPALVIDEGVSKAAAGRFSLVLKADGTLLAMGDDVALMAGVDDPDAGGGASQFNEGQDADVPVPVAEGVQDVAASGGVGYFTKADGSLWAIGMSLNDGRAQRIADGPIRLAAGHSGALLFVKADGSLWSVGAGWTQMLGTGDQADRTEPFRVEASGVVDLSVGSGNVVYLKEDGTAWGMGRNRLANLGLGHNDPVLSPQRLSLDGQPTDAVADVWIDGGHTLILTQEGQLWGTGDNYHRQLQRDARYFNAANRSLRRKYGLNNWPAVPVRLFKDRSVSQAIGNAACTLIVDGAGELWTVGWHPTVSMSGGLYELEGDQRLESRQPRQLTLPED